MQLGQAFVLTIMFYLGPILKLELTGIDRIDNEIVVMDTAMDREIIGTLRSKSNNSGDKSTQSSNNASLLVQISAKSLTYQRKMYARRKSYHQWRTLCICTYGPLPAALVGGVG
jgi:hypothetical protein